MMFYPENVESNAKESREFNGDWDYRLLCVF